MKKYFILIFLIFVISFFGNFSVFAKEYSVCENQNKPCDYLSLDDALTDLSLHHTEEEESVSLYLKNSLQTLSKDYSISFPLAFSNIDGDRISINGGGHSITSTNTIIFDLKDVVLSNISFFTKNFNSFYSTSSYMNPFLLFYSQNLTLNSVKIQNNDPFKNDGTFSAISFNNNSYMQSLSVTNLSVLNFPVAIDYDCDFYNSIRKREESVSNSFFSIEDVGYNSQMPFPLFLTITDSHFSNNSLFLCGSFKGNVSKSRLSSIYLERPYSYQEKENESYVVLEEDNDYGNVPIKWISIGHNHDGEFSSSGLYSTIFQKPTFDSYLFLMRDSNSVIEVHEKKEKTYDSSRLKKVGLLTLFVDIDEKNLSNYVFTVSDESVAKIEDHEIIFLKKGNVDIVATNPVTKETYTVVFRMTENPKTFNSFLFFSIIFMMISFLTFLICIPKKRSIY